MTTPHPSPNPGGQNRRLMRNALADWLAAQRIQGLKVGASAPIPGRVRWEDWTPNGSAQFQAQTFATLPHTDEDRAAYTGPEDPGGKLAHYSVQLPLYHLGNLPDEAAASEDDYDRIVDAIKDCFRGYGRDLNRPDVILQVGEYPRTSSISDDHEEPILVNGGIYRTGVISLVVSQYMQRYP